MAKREERLDYTALTRKLAVNGPDRLYLLSGPESYLRELFLKEIKKLCLSENDDDFSYHRIEGPAVDMAELADSVNALPFVSERTLTEVRGFDINKCRDTDCSFLDKILADIPEYATVVFVQDAGYEVDWRLKAAKSIKKYGEAVKFTSQDQKQLLPWIRKRFSSLGKTIDPDAATQLVYVSGVLMSGLIPEIEKIAESTESDHISRTDVDRFASRIPEARVFDMTDCMAVKDYDGAARLLADLIASGEEPIMTLAVIGQQMRRLYTARLAIDEKLGAAYVNEICGIKYDFITNKLMTSARGFTLPQLVHAVELCAEADYAMKSSSEDDSDLMKELFVKLAMGETV